MKKIISVLVIAAFLFGCTAAQQQYAIKSAMITMETQELKKQYYEVETLIRSRQDDAHVFTDEEWRSLLNVDATMDMLITKYDAIERLDVASLNIEDVKFMWHLAAQGYREARSVVGGHMEEFSPSTQILLSTFDRQAEMTSEKINDLISDPNNENINQSLVMIAGALGLVVKLLSVGVAAL